ncbi:GTP-binding protein At3g49725, chloroplastic isoform X2 [Prunus dulcis]|uniref:GTP-binding protein At3g49725, chloroplastic isoform X2 n=1 Tax=Prunus dulcis TaxID=3755 RepID=UPI001482E962|nr:GTP-binding protein At3g49725, chloroplastic isoform X2 [Prunus dulcis]
MLRTISLSRSTLRSFSQTRTHLCSNPIQTPSPPSTPSILISYSFYSTSSKQEKEDKNDVASVFNRDPTVPPKLFVVQPRLRPDNYLQAKLNEALCLANSLEEQRDGYFDVDFFDKEIPPHIVVQNPIVRHQTRADTYFGKGTLEVVKCHLNALEEKGEVDAIFVNTILSGIQQRNLEAELAALMYKKTRLVRLRGKSGRSTFGTDGEAEVVSARGRGSGGRGFISGAGETELQLQRRRISERRSSLLLQIQEVRRTRAVQRAGRKNRGGSYGQGLPTVAVVGYTNAGKSTLVSALSNSDLYSDSRLFATVDPKLRSVFLPSGKKVLVSDTVGFISDLPVQLVEAFHATLEEVVEADLLVHVLDCTAPNRNEHRSTVFQVLDQIGVSKEKLENMIEVWNKIDYQEEGMDFDECVDDIEDGEASSFSGEKDDMDSELSSGAENDEAFEAIDDQDGDYSDGWLASEDVEDPWGEGGSCTGLKTTDDQQSECPKDWKTEKQLQLQVQSGPHVRTSALMGVGLQELLELIDEKLKEAPKANVVERDPFDRKWRPPRTEEAGVAVEQ